MGLGFGDVGLGLSDCQVTKGMHVPTGFCLQVAV